MNLVRAKMDLEPRPRPKSWITCPSLPLLAPSRTAGLFGCRSATPHAVSIRLSRSTGWLESVGRRASSRGGSSTSFSSCAGPVQRSVEPGRAGGRPSTVAEQTPFRPQGLHMLTPRILSPLSVARWNPDSK
jgi:hypothetical protein